MIGLQLLRSCSCLVIFLSAELLGLMTLGLEIDET